MLGQPALATQMWPSPRKPLTLASGCIWAGGCNFNAVLACHFLLPPQLCVRIARPTARPLWVSVHLHRFTGEWLGLLLDHPLSPTALSYESQTLLLSRTPPLLDERGEGVVVFFVLTIWLRPLEQPGMKITLPRQRALCRIVLAPLLPPQINLLQPQLFAHVPR